MPTPEYVEFISLRIGSQALDDVIVDVTESTDTPTKTVNTMNKRRRARGYKQGNTSFGLDVTAEQIVDPNIPDWETLVANRTEFSITKTPSAGPTVTYSRCRATSAQRKTSDGDGSYTVKVIALEKNPN
ncbi:MAG TPA: hypothetical protein VKP14_10170 [Gaiellaceae bacterium]|nr:hypothetical protein [Gaiellaceae bacterium]